MPLPDVIIEIIKRLDETFQPNAMRKEYTDNLPAWRLYLDLYELDKSKLMTLVDAHKGDEPTDKLAMRRDLAAVFNYVPTIIKMSVNYLFSETPTIESKDDGVSKFIANCDGSGTSLSEYIRQTALPLSLVIGMIDTLVQNPATPAEMFVTAADETQENLLPRVFTITPVSRINWSTRPTHDYNWIAFKDTDNESPNPFIEDPNQGSSFVRIVSHYTPIDEAGNEIPLLNNGKPRGFWLRSWIDRGQGEGFVWKHTGDWLPTAQVPIATMYYSRSVDPERRHAGISKVSMIAILTRKIIQLLSWTDEDVLSNLALFTFPGAPPKDPNDPTKNLPVDLSPWNIIWTSNDAKAEPSRIQGEVQHETFKLELIRAYITEIMRLAFLVGISAEAELITSGVQGVVARNELFMELTELANGLDRYALDLLVMATQSLYSEAADMSREDIISKYGLSAGFFKGPYAVDPLDVVIKNTQSLINLFREVSPEMLKAVLEQCAASALYNEDERLTNVKAEILSSLGNVQAQRTADAAALASTLDAGPVAGTTPGVQS